MSELVTEPRMLIDGKLAPALSGRRFANVNPATEEVLGTVADGSAEDMDAAIDAARTAFDRSGWADDLDLRIRCLRQLEEALTKHADEFRATVVAEVGCPVSLTRMAQYDTPVKGIGWVADLAGSY
ncbi:MAG: aldehyde dehydrogenase, partial [Frankiales bacterium]|nr:aldehyde dehydrogenase [Frankiales bacterium]